MMRTGLVERHERTSRARKLAVPSYSSTALGNPDAVRCRFDAIRYTHRPL
jgi:hypothetical protein